MQIDLRHDGQAAWPSLTRWCCLALMLRAWLYPLQRPAHALQWARSTGGVNSDDGRGITVDASGNSYVSGYFSGTMHVGSKTLTGSGNDGLFVAKYIASGNVLWARSGGGTSSEAASTPGNSAPQWSRVRCFFRSVLTQRASSA